MNQYESEYDYFNTSLKIVMESNNSEIVKQINHEIVYKANQLQFLFDYYDTNSDLYKLNTDKTISITDENVDLKNIILLSMVYKTVTNNYFNIDDTFSTKDTIFVDNRKIMIMNKINLGAISKGYFLDYCSKLLEQYNEKAYINFGGSILNYYNSLNIGLKNVHNYDENLLIIRLSKAQTLHTSATFEQKLPHYLSPVYQPARKYEAKHLKSVTIIDKISNRSDALATAVFAMETPLGVAFCKENDIAAIIIDTDKIYINYNLIDKVKINSKTFEIIAF